MNQDIAAFLAPATLLIGSGLFSAGALSFLKVHFFKTKIRETAAIAAGLAFLVVTELIFVTSSLTTRFFGGQAALVSVCQLDAETALPQERHKKSEAMHNYVVGCMRGFEYEWTTEHRNCLDGPLATNAFCYLPMRPFDRAVTRLQMKFG